MTEVLTGPNRRVELHRPSNMRELGGLPTSHGGTLRRGAVFRAGGLHRLDGDDVATVRSLGLRTLVDLRTQRELSSHGQAADALAPRRLHYPMIPDVWDLRRVGADEPVEGYFSERYEEMLDYGSEAIASTLALLSEPASCPLGFFCAAGKDRTGVMSAVVLRVLGVPDEAIVADYVLSGPELDRLIAKVGDQERWGTERMAGGGPPALLLAPAGAMRTFLARLPAGDTLASTFGASGEMLRERLLEAPA